MQAGTHGNHKPGLVKARLPLHPSSWRGEKEGATGMQRWGGLNGKGGRPAGAETLSGGQPEAACKGTRGISTPPPLSHPSSNLPSWETHQKPKGKEAWWGTCRGSSLPRACSKEEKVESGPGSSWLSHRSRWSLAVVPTVQCYKETKKTAYDWQTRGREEFGDWGA